MDWTFRQLLARQTPVCVPCDDLEERECAAQKYEINAALARWGFPRIDNETLRNVAVFGPYEVRDLGCFNLDVWKRVLFYNKASGKDTGKLKPPPWDKSLLGDFGHIERANAWTHIAGGLLYMIYVRARPYTPQGATQSLSDVLAYAALWAYIFTFYMSACYHVYSANYVMSAITRLGDYFGIYLGISAGTLADVSLTSKNLALASWQAVADVWIGMAVLVAFFVYRRVQLPIHKTRLPYMGGKCSFGLARSTNVDLEHCGLRAAAGLAMALGWIQVIPAAFATLELDCALVLTGGRLAGTALLILGMFWDNVLVYPVRTVASSPHTSPQISTLLPRGATLASFLREKCY